jgi:hypothetical protein
MELWVCEDLISTYHCRYVFISIAKALGIGAASFWSAAEKDIAESPTALPERPKQRYKVLKKCNIFAEKVLSL